jgi:hypothetical protein
MRFEIEFMALTVRDIEPVSIKQRNTHSNLRSTAVRTKNVQRVIIPGFRMEGFLVETPALVVWRPAFDANRFRV